MWRASVLRFLAIALAVQVALAVARCAGWASDCASRVNCSGCGTPRLQRKGYYAKAAVIIAIL